MAEFKAIETQEEFEELLKPRLARATETARKKAFEEFQNQLDEANGFREKCVTLESSLNEKDETIKTLQAQLDESNTTAKKYEVKAMRTQAIVDNKLPMEFIDRLQGETAEEIQADAENLAELLKTNNRSYINLPSANNDDKIITDSKERGFNELLNKLKGE